jgi:hypothetical protein
LAGTRNWPIIFWTILLTAASPLEPKSSSAICDNGYHVALRPRQNGELVWPLQASTRWKNLRDSSVFGYRCCLWLQAMRDDLTIDILSLLSIHEKMSMRCQDGRGWLAVWHQRNWEPSCETRLRMTNVFVAWALKNFHSTLSSEWRQTSDLDI